METQEFHAMYKLEDHFWWFVVKRKFIQRILSLISLPQKAKILDIGCGTGINLQLLSKLGTAYGLDPSKLAIKYCQKRGLKNLQKGTVNQLPYKNNYFDLVTLFDVLSHQSIPDDQKALKEIQRVIKTGGYLLFTDIAYQFLWSSHDLAYHVKKRYSKRELINQLQLAGFSVLKSSYYFFTTFLLLVVNRLLKKIIDHFNQGKLSSDVKPIFNFLNQLFILTYQPEIHLIKYLNMPTGSSLIILAKK